MIDVFIIDYQNIDNCLLSIYLQNDREKLNLYIVIPTGVKIDSPLFEVLSPTILEFDKYDDRDLLYQFCINSSKGKYFMFLNQHIILYDKYVTYNILKLMSRSDVLIGNMVSNDDNNNFNIPPVMSVFGKCYRRSVVHSHIFDFLIHDYNDFRVKNVVKDLFYMYF